MHCPICDRRMDWDTTPPYRIGDDGVPVPLERDPRASEATWRDLLGMAYRPCGDPQRPGTHLLPFDYADYTPVSIGMIGHSAAGKTHLLAAMISRLCSNDAAIRALGLRVGPLDLRIHQRYMAESVTPLVTHRRRLRGTAANTPMAFCDALKVTNAAGRSFALTFFDIAGERLERPDDGEVRFYASADALMFIVDPEALPRPGRAGTLGDRSFEVALHRLASRPRPDVPGALHPVAAAVIVAKADLIRFEDQLASDWLARGSGEEEVDLGTVERESEDVYAYLAHRGANSWLRPAQECFRSTLHFASATNCPAVDDRFPGAFRQCRVLKPLLSVFAMTGILEERLLRPASGVGTPG